MKPQISVKIKNCRNIKPVYSVKHFSRINDQRLATCSINYKRYVRKQYFSISHSFPYCVFVEDDEPIGIDIENVKRKFNFTLMKKQIFSNNEQQFIKKSRSNLVLLWACKESLIKCLKTNLNFLQEYRLCFNNNDEIYYLNKTSKHYFSYQKFKHFYIVVCSKKNRKIKIIDK